MNHKSLYELLGVTRTCTRSQLKSAYYSLAKKFHPDSGNVHNDLHFREITSAYQTLSDPEQRAMYDAQTFRTVSSSSVDDFCHQSSAFTGTGYHRYTPAEGWDFASERSQMNSEFYGNNVDGDREIRKRQLRQLKQGLAVLSGLAIFLWTGKYFLFQKVYRAHVLNLDKQEADIQAKHMKRDQQQQHHL